jgi:hypothetical protein
MPVMERYYLSIPGRTSRVKNRGDNFLGSVSPSALVTSAGRKKYSGLIIIFFFDKLELPASLFVKRIPDRFGVFYSFPLVFLIRMSHFCLLIR